MKKAPLVWFALFFGHSWAVIAQSGSDTIFWHPNQKLEFGDFKAPVPAQSIYQAVSATGISYTMASKHKRAEFTAIAYFLPGQSWMKQKPAQHLLNHEQIHFEITQYYAFRLLQKLQTDYVNQPPTITIVRSLADSIIAEKNNLQKLYDLETQHGSIILKQREWASRIRGWLFEFSKCRTCIVR